MAVPWSCDPSSAQNICGYTWPHDKGTAQHLCNRLPGVAGPHRCVCGATWLSSLSELASLEREATTAGHVDPHWPDVPAGRLEAIEIRPGDLIAYSPGTNTADGDAQAVMDHLAAEFHDNATILLDPGSHIEVYRPTPVDEAIGYWQNLATEQAAKRARTPDAAVSLCVCGHGPGYHAPHCHHLDRGNYGEPCPCDAYWNTTDGAPDTSVPRSALDPQACPAGCGHLAAVHTAADGCTNLIDDTTAARCPCGLRRQLGPRPPFHEGGPIPAAATGWLDADAVAEHVRAAMRTTPAKAPCTCVVTDGAEAIRAAGCPTHGTAAETLAQMAGSEDCTCGPTPGDGYNDDPQCPTHGHPTQET